MTDREPVDVTKEQLTVLCVKPGEKPKRIEIESGLDALQRAVGGYIETLWTRTQKADHKTGAADNK